MSESIAKTEHRHPILQMIQKRYPEYHPLMALAELAHEDVESRIKLQCHQTIAKYVESELRSIEFKGHVQHDFGLLRVTVEQEQTFDVDYTIDGVDYTPISEEPQVPQLIDDSENQTELASLGEEFKPTVQVVR